MRVAALAGGVGGAKLADGLAQVIAPELLTVIVNTGDDFTHLGLRICPDLDTVCYTLAGIANPETGWGRADESWNALESLRQLGGPDWFRLGDRDLGVHLERTRRLESGDRLSQVTQHFCQVWGVKLVVLPMSDDPVATWVETEEGELAFQEYFVQHACRPVVKGFRFAGSQEAKPAAGVLEALDMADVVIFCPSNPWVSLDPILSIPGVRESICRKKVVAVSPIIGGKTVKGPAAKMFTELGIQPSAMAVYQHYQDLLSGFVIDDIDQKLAQLMQGSGVIIRITNTIMRSKE
jgi:LPPG:FO 2-phospho-L-lactate transferase